VSDPRNLVLVVRRTIDAGAARLFDAWTKPEHLLRWWGPAGVRCADAEVDLRVGGRYRIVNALPDGTRMTIEGEFRVVEAPHRLVYTWHLGGSESSLVTVRFEPRDPGTEVIVTHEQIPAESVRVSHEKGWNGCLDGLVRFAAEK
jgi:uncharacterized protein YndB with AHSA1/START domain